jgi:hypothetical protein
MQERRTRRRAVVDNILFLELFQRDAGIKFDIWFKQCAQHNSDIQADAVLLAVYVFIVRTDRTINIALHFLHGLVALRTGRT